MQFQATCAGCWGAALAGGERWGGAAGARYHPDPVWDDLRLASGSLWDVPVDLPGDVVLHVLASHPTPPVFDGPEDFNGRRNADEIRLLLGLIDGAAWLRDDRGKRGGLGPGDLFVVVGDLNADPFDGEARRGAITALLAPPRVPDPRPDSAGGAPVWQATNSAAPIKYGTWRRNSIGSPPAVNSAAENHRTRFEQSE